MACFRSVFLACTLLAAFWGVVAQEDVGEEVGNSSSAAKSRPTLAPQVASAHLAKMLQGYDTFVTPGAALKKPEITIVKAAIGIMAIHGVSIGAEIAGYMKFASCKHTKVFSSALPS